MAYSTGGYTSERTNGMAVASLVLGIVGLLISLFGVLPILAIVFGAVGRRQIDQGGGRGRGMATAGLILGVIGLILFVVVLVVVGIHPTSFGHG